MILKSYTNFINESTENSYESTLYKMKKMPAFSREKFAVGKGYWSWDLVYPNSNDSYAINKYGVVSYDSGGNWMKIDDEQIIKKITDSIDSVYEYMFESEEHNKLHQIVRSFFYNNVTTPKNVWQKLFNQLIERKKFKALEVIYWKKSDIEGDIDTIIRSAKGINKFDL